MQLRGSQSMAWNDRAPDGIRLEQVHFGTEPAFQVAVARAASVPALGTMRALRDGRRGKKLMSLAVVVVHGDRASVLGPGQEQQAVLGTDAAARALQAALDQPSEIEAVDRLRELLDGEDDALLGCQNRGLFARHFLEHRVPQRADWQSSRERGGQTRDRRGVQLIDALGFHRSQGPNGTQLLSAGGGKATRAIAVLLDRGESWDAPSARFELSPVAFGLREAAERETPWLVVVSGDRVRLYSGKPGVGVGHQGQVDTYFELDLAVAGDEQIGLLPLVFSAEALAAGGSAQQLLEGSANYSTELGTRLRERIYEHVVPDLAIQVANQLPALGIPLDERGLQRAYGAALRILFRLLFQAYAEDRELLPAGRNDRYDANSLKSFVKREKFTNPHDFGSSNSIWSDLTQVWDVIDQGNPLWQVPAYSGGLFSKDPVQNPDGALIEQLRIPDSVLGPALQSLMLDTDTDGTFGPVDFSSMSVREFGTIYEGLLESSLSVAETDMTVDAKGAWVPVRGDADPVLAAAGSVYFHSASGERKATGSYFTPKIIVDHLVERSVRPATERHLSRIAELLDAGRKNEAALQFFDLRVADLAMGSGHFLVAAIDEIEARMRDFLTKRPIVGVQDELRRIAATANAALGDDDVAKGEVEDVGLLRRQVARRCVYGLDINPLSVELARLAIWIHTFVPGLPLSSLDHTLVCANSLTGIGTVDEALGVLIPKRRPDERTLLDQFIEEPLERGAELLRDAAAAGEADRAEIAAAAELAGRAANAVEPVKRLFDAAVALRTGAITPEVLMTPESIDEFVNRPVIAETAEQLQPAHMPVLFPEVFLRENPGFDALVGNPPWEETTVEELKFWTRYSAGLGGLSTAQRELEMARLREDRPDLLQRLQAEQAAAEKIRKGLLAGPYEGMGTGDADLYKAFAWRNWQVLRSRGIFGVVMPLSLWMAKGSGAWRLKVLAASSCRVTFLRNTDGWIFPEVNPGYRMSPTTIEKDALKQTVYISGPFSDATAFASGVASEVTLDSQVLIDSDPDACLPGFTRPEDIGIWSHLLQFQGLGDGRLADSREDIRCAPATEIHATNVGKKGEKLFVESLPDCAVYNHLNIGEFMFEESAGEFAQARFERVVSWAQNLRERTWNRKDSAFSLRERGWAFDEDTLPLKNPRIAIRDVVHASNPKKVWAALVPANKVLTNKAPYLVFADDNVLCQSFVLGVLNSGVVDWFGHLRVNLNLNFFILYTLVVPRKVV